jgi:glutamate dehydrogenase (NAD(P)+)
VPARFTCSNEELLTVDCEVLIPAALEGVLTKRNAAEVRARVIVEGANGPTEPEADEIFEKRGVLVVPDILANAGGVTVSYFEWVQNMQHLTWEEDRVNVELEKIMKDAYERISQISRTRKIPLRTAAYILAIGRVGKATVLRGI